MLVQKLRLQRGWSQQQLADLSGLSVRTIQRIENGKSSSAESLKSLAAVFEIDFNQLHKEPDMNSPLTSGVSREEALALQQVRKIKKFYCHAIKYLVIVGALAVLNIVQLVIYQWPWRLGFFWVQWVALGWGIWLFAHALSAFDLIPFFGVEWEKKQVEKRLGRSL
jgi:transcriptional regulator with XRE-family HTH domain